ncbi:LysE family translocator [Actinomadura yumaensis]|uniref:LysE family translocator n=1 Tax=Actinomadura yumaensis TaxID=111807 RepID=A0ABW2CW87_9ACTN
MLGTLIAFVGAAVLIAVAPGPSTVVIMRQSLRSGRRAGLATVLGNETGVLAWGVAAAVGLSALLSASRLAYDGFRIAGAVVLVWFGVRALREARRGGPGGRAWWSGWFGLSGRSRGDAGAGAAGVEGEVDGAGGAAGAGGAERPQVLGGPGDAAALEAAGAARDAVGVDAARDAGNAGDAAGPDAAGVGVGGVGEGASLWRSFRLGLITNFANPKAGVFAVSFLPQFVPPGWPVLATLVALSVLWALIDLLWYAVVVWLVGAARRLVERPIVRRRLEQVSGVVLVGLGVRLAAESR